MAKFIALGLGAEDVVIGNYSPLAKNICHRYYMRSWFRTLLATNVVLF